MIMQPPPDEVADNASTPPQIALIYDDIRATLGNPVVNLVFRRLAALGVSVLSMVWQGMRPAYADGRLNALADALAPPMPLPVAGLLAGGGWAARSDAAVMRRIVLEYDRNNRRNLIALTALFAAPQEGAPGPVLRQGQSLRALRTDPWSDAMQTAPLADTVPPLPQPGTLDAATRARLSRLDAFGDPGTGPPQASLYRHLAHWPDFLHDAEAALAPLHARGAFLQATAVIQAQAARAAQLLPDLAMEPAFQARIDAAVGPLVRRIIPKMIPVGRALGTLLLPAARGDA